MAALTGGGMRAKPGEISLRIRACCSSMSCRSSIQVLIPCASRWRTARSQFPRQSSASPIRRRFMLVAAMNPAAAANYRAILKAAASTLHIGLSDRISGPLDGPHRSRIEVPAVTAPT